MRSSPLVVPHDLFREDDLSNNEILMHSQFLVDVCSRVLHETRWDDPQTVAQVTVLADTMQQAAATLEGSVRDLNSAARSMASACTTLNAVYNDHGKTLAMADDMIPALRQYRDGAVSVRKIGANVTRALSSTRDQAADLLQHLPLDAEHAAALPDTSSNAIMSAFRARLAAHRRQTANQTDVRLH